MAQLSAFFDAKLVDNEYDRVYVAEQFASYFASFIGNGIFNNHEAEIITVKENDPRNMSVVVTPGQAWINGYWYQNTDDVELSVEIADGVRNRIDAVVIRWDKAQRNIYLKVLKGETAVKPVPPAPERGAEYFDLVIAHIDIKAGTVNIAQRMITDTRMNNEDCGFVTGTVEQVDTTTLFDQFEEFYNNFVTVQAKDFSEWSISKRNEFIVWFDSVTDVLDGKEVTNLINLINKLRNNIGEVFNYTTQYEVGQYCYNDNVFYRCTVRHKGEWDDAHFVKTTIAEELYALQSNVVEEVRELQEEVSGYGNNIKTLQSDMSSVKNRNISQDSSISSLSSSINTINNNISDLGTIRTNVGNHTTAISNMQVTVSGHTTSISSLSSTVSGLSSSVSTLSSNLANKQDIYSGAGYHNSIYRGKYLGSTFTTAQKNAISNGTFNDLYIGDYWTNSSGEYFIIGHFINMIFRYGKPIVVIIHVPNITSTYGGSAIACYGTSTLSETISNLSKTNERIRTFFGDSYAGGISYNTPTRFKNENTYEFYTTVEGATSLSARNFLGESYFLDPNYSGYRLAMTDAIANLQFKYFEYNGGAFDNNLSSLNQKDYWLVDCKYVSSSSVLPFYLGYDTNTYYRGRIILANSKANTRSIVLGFALK